MIQNICLHPQVGTTKTKYSIKTYRYPVLPGSSSIEDVFVAPFCGLGVERENSIEVKLFGATAQPPVGADSE